ncbi:MAG TPA: PilZ domain-containing protein [Anaerolineaceae bacterium]|nr:PilZ domain-containing protein [Anaerolineaceae bacterium]
MPGSSQNNPIAIAAEAVLQMADQQTPLTLTRSYKGMLLFQEAKILAVHPGYAIFEACDIKAFVDVSGMIHLHTPLYDRPICARVIGCDLGQCRLMLTDFVFASNEWQDRSKIRVQPRDPVYLTLHCGRQSVLASLHDIQAGGISVMASQANLQVAGLQPGYPVRTSFQVGSLVLRRLEGSVEYIRQASQTLARIGIRIQPRKDQLDSLQRYIDRRQAEILQELDRSYFRSMGPRRVEELYF